MRKPKGKPEVTPGTPPSPENPKPSNQIIETYPGGPTIIRTPRPTERVLEEYVEALGQHPNDAGLHLEFANALRHVDRNEEAVDHAREAVRLRPDWYHARAVLGFLLQNSSVMGDAIHELREAIRLLTSQGKANTEQMEALLHSGLSEILHGMGKTDEAQAEIQTAIALERVALREGRGSKQTLRQLQEKEKQIRNLL